MSCQPFIARTSFYTIFFSFCRSSLSLSLSLSLSVVHYHFLFFFPSTCTRHALYIFVSSKNTEFQFPSRDIQPPLTRCQFPWKDLRRFTMSRLLRKFSGSIYFFFSFLSMCVYACACLSLIPCTLVNFCVFSCSNI